MGNSSSLGFLSKKRIAQPDVDQIFSGNDDDDYNDDEEELEVEVGKYNSNESEAVSSNNLLNGPCTNEKDHSEYTPVQDIYTDSGGRAFLEKLPEDIRHNSLLEFIKIQEKLVVRIRSKKCSPKRPESKDCTAKPENDSSPTGPENDSSSSRPENESSPANPENDSNTERPENEKSPAKQNTEGNFGTGYVYISSDLIQKYPTCPINDCSHNDGRSHKNYGGMIVYTNHHVIYDKTEAEQTEVDFFYNGQEGKEIIHGDVMVTADDTTLEQGGSISSSSITGAPFEAQGMHHDSGDAQSNDESGCTPKIMTAKGISLRQVEKNKDLVGMRILCHDPQLYHIVKKYSDRRQRAWSVIPQQIKNNLEKYVIIISHPHGKPKQVSFGPLQCLEREDKKIKGRKFTQYMAATCEGSSGAPVVTAHYRYRPFVHSSKHKKKHYGISYSY